MGPPGRAQAVLGVCALYHQEQLSARLVEHFTWLKPMGSADLQTKVPRAGTDGTGGGGDAGAGWQGGVLTHYAASAEVEADARVCAI